MTLIVACPKCGRKLRVKDENLGKKVRCPDCKETFDALAEGGGDDDVVVAALDEAAAEEEVPEKPARRSGLSPKKPAKRKGKRDDAEADYDDDRPAAAGPRPW